jgi:hypothetical protein
MAKRVIWTAAAVVCTAAALAACQKNGGGQQSSMPASSEAPASAAPASAQVQPTLTPGVVSEASATSLTVTVQGAPSTFKLTPATTIMVTHKGSLSDIKAGVFLGTTNVPDASGTGSSTEVHIFPPGVKMGEGDRPMPSAPGAAASRMTNGTVTAAGSGGGSRMTNGAAGNVSGGGQGVQMDVAYQGGTRHVVVTPSTPISVMSSGTPDMLKAGTKVLVGHTPAAGGGPDEASFINITP